MRAGLGDGFTVRIRDDIRIADAGRTLVGGSPLRAVRLTDRAAALVEHGRIRVRDEATRVLAERLLDADLVVPVLGEGSSCPASELTVVVPVRDRADELEALLAELCPELACIVVDDASRDPAAVAGVAGRLGARLVVLERNLGAAGARNAGLRQVRTPLVAFVDCDVTADPQVFLRLGAHFADQRLALVGPLVKGRSWSARPRWFERYDELASSLDLGTRPSGVRPGGAVAWLPGACLVARTCALAGGFDDTLRVGEDVDLVWRLTGEGWRVRYDPGLQVAHRTRTTVAGWLGRKYVYGTGGAPLAERHGNLIAPFVASPTYAVAALGLLAQRRWSVVVVAAAVIRAAYVLHRTLPDTPARPGLAVYLAARGLGWTAQQSSGLLLRHWWPVAAAGSLVSRRVRRAVFAAALADLVRYWPYRSRMGLLPFAAARRLDDLAYGAGLWAGALHARSARALQPRISGTGSLRALVAGRIGRTTRSPHAAQN